MYDHQAAARLQHLEGELIEAKEQIRLLLGQSPAFDPLRRLFRFTGKELEMFAFLLSRCPATITKEALHQALYGDDPAGGPEIKIIDVFICKIRKKLTTGGMPEGGINTVWGKGYMMTPDARDWTHNKLKELGYDPKVPEVPPVHLVEVKLSEAQLHEAVSTGGRVRIAFPGATPAPDAA